MSARALVVDDEPAIRELLVMTLERMQVTATAVATLDEARQQLARQAFDVCLTDMRLPDGDGLDLVAHMQARHPEVPVAVITAHGHMEAAVEALKRGAFDFVSKPVDLGVLRRLVNDALRLRVQRPAPTVRLIGESPAMVQLRATLAKLARSQAPVFIGGESGTGKELVARLIHLGGPRAEAPFVPVNCGAIPSELLESEFFGHRKGAFTGATQDSPGLFGAAQGGTLFLDEVADLPLPMQVKLLRALQEKRVRPVGAQQEVAIDCRILSASHKDLAALVARGAFRQDLFYRIHVIAVQVPALRERREDLPLLVEHLLSRISGDYGMAEPPVITPAALHALCQHGFPGNVRELENLLERAVALSEGGRIDVADLQLEGPTGQAAGGSSPDADSAVGRDEAATATRPVDPDLIDTQPGGARPPLPGEAGFALGSLDAELGTVERQRILAALEQTRWNRTAAARLLGITLRALRYRLEKLGIE
jgi:two-component system, NtrC family, response regulator PilR